MRKCCLLLAVGLLLAFSVQSLALTADEIINKHIEAKGGMEEMEAAKSMVMTGKMTMQGMEVPFTVSMKRPAKFRMDATFQGFTIVQAYNGETGWHIQPFGGTKDPQAMSEAQLRDARVQADFDGMLIGYKDAGYTAEMIGEEMVGETKAYHLQLTDKDSTAYQYYLDAATFLPLKTSVKQEAQGVTYDVVTEFGDFKEVAGVMMPHSIKTSTAGQLLNSMAIEKIEVNIDVDDAIFEMPVAEAKEEPAGDE